MATNHNPEKGPVTLSCEAWEAMLADVLDGTLDGRDREAFDAHSKSCAGCGELLEEATRGSEWLRFLRETPPAPEGLLEKILAGTTGLPAAEQPLAAAGAIAIPRQPWLDVPMGVLHRHAAESRMLMTLAMAFFSIALTLNLTGVRLNQLKLSDLKPSTLATSLSHQYFTSYAHMRRYYDNLRIVYMLESRVNEIRDNVRPPTGGSNQQPAAQPQPVQQNPQPQPAGSSEAPPRRGSSSARPVERQSPAQNAAPVLAANQPKPHRLHSQLWALTVDTIFPYPGDHYKPSERSLV